MLKTGNNVNQMENLKNVVQKGIIRTNNIDQGCFTQNDENTDKPNKQLEH